MDLPLLPESVRITPSELRASKDPPVYVFRPVTGMEQASALVWLQENAGTGYARVAFEHLQSVEGLTIGGTPFDKANEKHIAALDGTQIAEMGKDLWERTHLTEQEQGKSSSPSASS
jgi:hypothetical protein